MIVTRPDTSVAGPAVREVMDGVRVMGAGSGEKVSLTRALAEPAGALLAMSCLRGSLQMGVLCDEAVLLEKGDVLLFETSDAAPVAMVATSPVTCVVVTLRLEELGPEAAAALAGFDVDVSSLREAAQQAPVLLDAGGDAAHALLDVAVARRGGNDAALKIRTVEFLRCLCAEISRQPAHSHASGTHGGIALQARALMHEHISDPLTIAELACACQTSPTVLKDSFREEFGLPVHEWYRRFRMMRAASMLAESNLAVADVARAVGYSNASKFAQAFSACMGATPSAWRREALSQA